jgi:MFS family permease
MGYTGFAMLTSNPKTSHPFRAHRHSLAHNASLPALATNRLLGFSASAVVGVFLPIFLYEFFGFSIQLVLLWYAINFAFKLPFHVWAAKIFSRTGLVPSMIIGTLGIMVFYWMFYLLDAGSSINPYVLMGIGIFGLMIVSVFYWSPFNIDFAKSTSSKHRGKQIGVFYAAQRLLSVIAPVVAGWVIVTYGYKLNFALGLLISATSIVPLLFLPAYKVKYEFGFFESFRKLFSKTYRGMSASMMAYGAENIVGVTVWPIFLFAIFKGDYLNVGLFTAVIVVISLALEVFIGKEADRFSPRRLLKIGTGVYALGWLWKGLVETVVGVFAASTFHNLGSIMLRTPMDTLMYEQAADSGHYVDEYTVLREVALSTGRTLMLLFLIFVTSVFSLSASFFIAAIVSLGINWLSDYHAKS